MRLDLLAQRIHRLANSVAALRLPAWAGAAAAFTLIVAAVIAGTIRGGHVPALAAWMSGVRDDAANAAGFRLAAVAVTGQDHVSREEVLATAGVTGRTSLLFLDAGDVRARLKTNPWIADATVQKLFPDRLQITVSERRAFALWQKDGRIAVVAADGTVLEPYLTRRFAGLPLVVGVGAHTRAKDFLALLDRHPGIRRHVSASVLVAERRWNLRLTDGIDVRLPEFGVERALDRLAALDRDKKIFSRDIVALDLRLPDRITVRLSDAAAEARAEALKAKRPRAKGGSA